MLPSSMMVVNTVLDIPAASASRPREAVKFGNFARNELPEFRAGVYFKSGYSEQPIFDEISKGQEMPVAAGDLSSGIVLL